MTRWASPGRVHESTGFVRVGSRAARALIARALLEPLPPVIRLGEIELAPHQREAVIRLQREIARRGGALLADAVGLGKTYVALALAAAAERPVVIAPAALRTMWRDALARTGVRAELVSTQRLSRGRPPVSDPDLVIVDEAHHFRNPATRRFAALAELTRRARVLLLTATPVHNDARELAALLSLFLGAAASGMSAAELARSVIRRDGGSAWGDAVPRVAPTRWIALPHRDDLLDAIAALPAPVPPSDGDDGGALLLFSLLRQWSSSDGALAAALRRRLARAAALIAALEEGRHPTHAELAAWRFTEDAMQLAFPGLVAAEAHCSTASLLEQARRHEDAVRSLLRLITIQGLDAERARRLRELRVRHPGERIVVFSQFADTIDAMWRELRRDPGVCALAGRGARVAGGAISRREALARFAPRAAARHPPTAAERIDLLLATELLSEGVNLQDASVIVHLDLPWTPARLEQRVGRLARPGAVRDTITVYAFAPPARAEAVLAVERRLRTKLREAARVAGVSGTILPGLLGGMEDGGASPAQHHECVRRALDRWRDGRVSGCADAIAVAAVRSRREGLLALIVTGGDPQLVASLGGPITDDPALVADAVATAEAGLDVDVDDRAIRTAIEHIESWLAFRSAEAGVELRLVGADRARRAVLRRAAAIVERAPRHDRPRLATLAHDASRAATASLGSGAERVLRELADASMPDEAWLRTVSAFGAAHRRGEPAAADPHAASASAGLRVMIILAGVPDDQPTSREAADASTSGEGNDA